MLTWPSPASQYHARRYPTVIRVLAYTGIRWAEMTALRVDSIDFDTLRFDIHRTDEHDGGKYKDGTPKNTNGVLYPFRAPSHRSSEC